MMNRVVDKLTKFHIAKRYYDFQKNKGAMKNIGLHNCFHNLLLPGMKLLRKLRNEDLTVIEDKRKRRDKPAVYACTHIGGFDIETLFEAIEEPCYLFLGDPREIYCNFDGLLLCMNGVICFETDNKQDRYIAKERAIQLMNGGGSLMIFPEGAWNIYQNLPVMPLYCGAADIALKSQTAVVPVAIERYGTKYFVNIGAEIEVAEKHSLHKGELTQIIRDELATLKWEIWEKAGFFERKKLSDTRESFIDQIFGQKNTSFTVEDVLRTRYYP